MTDRDWGADPAVRATREVFRLMEAGQRALLERAAVSPLDGRLRRWRSQALAVFERAWAEASRSGRPWSAEEAAGAYVEGLARLLASAGVAVPPDGGAP